MVTASTKSELEEALRNRVPKIRCTGALAEELKKKEKRNKWIKRGLMAVSIASIVAVPFTGGASAAGAAYAGAAAAGRAVVTNVVTKGATAVIGKMTFELTTKEFLILVCGATGLAAILKGCKVKINKDGSVEVEPTYKK